MCRYRSGVALLTVLALYARVALSEVVDSEVVQLERIVHLKTFCFDQSLASTFGRERLPGEPEVQDDENAASFTFSYTGANTTGLSHAQEWVRVPLPVPVFAAGLTPRAVRSLDFVCSYIARAFLCSTTPLCSTWW